MNGRLYYAFRLRDQDVLRRELSDFDNQSKFVQDCFKHGWIDKREEYVKRFTLPREAYDSMVEALSEGLMDVLKFHVRKNVWASRLFMFFMVAGASGLLYCLTQAEIFISMFLLSFGLSLMAAVVNAVSIFGLWLNRNFVKSMIVELNYIGQREKVWSMRGRDFIEAALSYLVAFDFFSPEQLKYKQRLYAHCSDVVIACSTVGFYDDKDDDDFDLGNYQAP